MRKSTTILLSVAAIVSTMAGLVGANVVIWNATISASNPLDWYRCNELAGGTLIDYAGALRLKSFTYLLDCFVIKAISRCTRATTFAWPWTLRTTQGCKAGLQAMRSYRMTLLTGVSPDRDIGLEPFRQTEAEPQNQSKALHD
jgi:hypothetical protein